MEHVSIFFQQQLISNASFQVNIFYADNLSYSIFHLDTIKIITNVRCEKVMLGSNIKKGTWVNNRSINMACKVHKIIIKNNKVHIIIIPNNTNDIIIRCNYCYILFFSPFLSSSLFLNYSLLIFLNFLFVCPSLPQ